MKKGDKFQAVHNKGMYSKTLACPRLGVVPEEKAGKLAYNGEVFEVDEITTRCVCTKDYAFNKTMFTFKQV